MGTPDRRLALRARMDGVGAATGGGARRRLLALPPAMSCQAFGLAALRAGGRVGRAPWEPCPFGAGSIAHRKVRIRSIGK